MPLQQIASVNVDKKTALEYLRKKEISIQSQLGWNLITCCELPLGWIKVLPNRINNYYPSEWRILKY
jgi:NOL1/NOP2/fmu family ribosome biogenesis protein